jgi:hypothetical protein
MAVGRWVYALVLAQVGAACSGKISGGSGGESAPGFPAADGGGSVAGRGGAGAADPDDGLMRASASVARRLSRAELDNTLRDLLGVESAPAQRLLPEDAYSPYDNDYPSQQASGALIESLETFASEVASEVASDAALRARLIPCTPKSASDAGCWKQLLEQLLPRAFRRPLRAGELDSYMPLLALAGERAAPSFESALELLLRALLSDPEFLYRVEAGAELDDYELAARLSYLVWGAPPDDALRSDAAAGRLRGGAARRDAFRRLWRDERAAQQVHRFHALWLGYRAIPHSPELARAFAEETSALLDRVIFEEPQSYLSVFSSSETYLDDSLADHYGLPRPDGGAGWVDYGDSGRAGILSHGSVMSAFSKFSDTSPTQRGIFVRTRLLCQEIPPPPPTVAADKPPPADRDAVCKWDRYAAHRSSSACASCHALTDAIGFGLENYDIAGRYRSHDEGLEQCAIDGAGELTGIGSFSGPKELGALLVERDLVAPCLVQQFAQFALGRKLESGDAALLAALRGRFEAAEHDFAKLIEDYVASDAFARRAEPEGEP